MAKRIWTIGRIAAGILLFIFLLGLIAFVLLSLPGVQNWSKAKLQVWINEHIENEISYSDFKFNIFTGGSVDDLLILDHHKDTLIFAKELDFSTAKSLSSLFNNELKINAVNLNGTTLQVIEYAGEWGNSLDYFIKQFDQKKDRKTTKKKPFDIAIQTVQLENTRHVRIREQTGIREEYYIQSAFIEIGSLMLPANYYYFKDLQITKPSIHIYKSNPVTNKIKATAPTRDSTEYYCKNPFILYFGKINLTQGDFHYKDFLLDTVTVPDETSINYKNFSLYNLNTDIHDFYYQNLEGTGKVQKFNCSINQTKTIKNFSADQLSIHRSGVEIMNFNLETDRSKIQDSFKLHYNEYSNILNFNHEVILDYHTQGSQIHINDISYFLKSAAQNSFFKRNKDISLNWSGQIIGRINSLKGFGITANLDNGLIYHGDFSIKNTTLKGKEFLDINIKKLTTKLEYISSLIPEVKMSPQLKNLGQINYIGNYTGYFEDFVTYGTMSTSLGNVKSDIRLNLRPGIESATFSGDLDFYNFDIGRLLDQKDLGKTTFTAYIKNGKGLTAKSINADLEAKIQTLSYNDYIYNNIVFNGKLSPELLDGKINVKEKNLDIEFLGKISNLQKEPNLNFDLKINKADLKELKLVEVGIIVSSEIRADLRNTKIDKIDGDLLLSNTSLYNYEKNRVLTLGDIKFSQLRKNRILSTTISSEFINAKITGEYKTVGIYNQLMTYLHQHYEPILKLAKINYKVDHEPTNYSAQFEGQSLARIFNFMGWNVKFDQFTANLENNTRNDSIYMKLSIDNLHYGDLHIPKITQTLEGSSKELTAHTTSPSIYFKQKNFSNALDIRANLDHDKAKVFIYSADSSQINTLYDLGIMVQIVGPDKVFTIINQDVVLHGKAWTLDQKGRLDLYQNSFEINNLTLEDSTSKIEIDDKGRQGLKILLLNLNLSSLNGLIGSPKVKFEGLFDTRVDIKNIYSFEEAFANVNISNLRINQKNYGRTKIDIGIPNPSDPAKIVFSNQYKETKIDGKGTFNLPLGKNYKHPKYEFNLDFNLESFPIAFLETFLTQIQNTQGNFNGKANLKYVDKKLLANGELVALDGYTLISYLNAGFKFHQQKIVLDDNEIIFNNISMTDVLDNPIAVDGIITHKNFVEYHINANLNSRKALILNTSKGQNPNFYGYGIGSFNVDFNGPTDRLDMTIAARSLRGSKLFLPISQEQVAEENRFVQYEIIDTIETISDFQPKTIKGMNILINLDVTEDAEIQILFDEKTGDILKGTGRGTLQIQSLRDNTFTIKGAYEIEDGQYLFTLFNFVNKPFRLKRGGTIQWTGDPLDANIRLEASYEKLSVSPAPLLQEYTSLDQELQEEIKNRTNVDLTMILTGSLLKPDISFDLAFPDATGNLKSLLENKLRVLKQNPDQLNQQVASLIAFRTFLGSNANVGAGLSNTTISTMSEFLSNQMSIFVSNLLSEAYENVGFISGVDFNINYDVNRNPNPLEQTRLNLNEGEVAFSVRHRLLNDQLAFTFGGNYGSNSPLVGNAYFNPESVIEWNTPVPGLKLRIYYKSVTSLQGLRHRVGAGVSRRKEFDSLFDFKKAIKDQAKENKKG